ncbi:Conserved_hypothetical protein [Hexamita inflata]|uniref:Uncharacterized protein n=1 Tax=Hexamita inflata TaxID=28002 RepID=A0AA86PUP3_9EUKA|nr:Conserved hypothetical protein [Hexamita inflata]
MNISILDSRIFANITDLKNDINTTYIKVDDNLQQNTTILDRRIFNNISQLNSTIQNQILQINDLNNSLQQQNLMIEQQKIIVDSLTQQLSCTRNYGFSMVNNQCIQVICNISGQYSINGICQCTNIDSIVQSGQCVCPTNSNVVGTVCVCFISGQTIQNGQCSCSTTGAFVDNNICTCGQNSLNISNTCSCASGASLINGICTCSNINAYISGNQCVCPQYSSLVGNTCICAIRGQQIINESCQCPSGQSVVNNSCKQINYIINTNFECSQEIFTSNFDIQSITNLISAPSNFSSGYVFSSSTVIQNAFIQIQDYIYSLIVYPLFQSQSTFINLKIQFGTQQLNSGSLIISLSSSISINQMNIKSSSGSYLTVSTSQLNILASTSTSTNITNLIVDLSFAPSNGNITLINNIKGVSNISGYQILGSFVSTGTVSMIGMNINEGSFNVNQVSVQPIMFNVGNSSSYLFGSSISTTNTFMINNIAIILGNNSNILLLGSIATTSQSLNYYQFGGIITYINSASQVSINNVMVDTYQKFSSGYITNFGSLVGQVESITSSITISNVCLSQNITSIAQYFSQFGLIGRNCGNSSIKNAQVIFIAQSVYQQSFGIIGIQLNNSLYAEVINLITEVSFSASLGHFVGSIFGAEYAKNCSIQNTTAVGLINGANVIGGFCGFLYSNALITILNSTISKSNISTLGGCVGGLFGEINGYISTVYLINSKIQYVRLSFGTNYGGIFTGFNQGIQQFVNSSSTSNYINDVLQSDCAILSNIWSAVGC